MAVENLGHTLGYELFGVFVRACKPPELKMPDRAAEEAHIQTMWNGLLPSEQIGWEAVAEAALQMRVPH